jgi:hypothetical protein
LLVPTLSLSLFCLSRLLQLPACAPGDDDDDDDDDGPTPSLHAYRISIFSRIQYFLYKYTVLSFYIFSYLTFTHIYYSLKWNYWNPQN